MTIDNFRYLFKRINGFILKPHWYMFRRPVELWNEETDESIRFKTVDEALLYVVDGERVADIIGKSDDLVICPLAGGRGSGSGANAFSGKFRGMPDRRKGKGGGEEKRHNPVEFNIRIKSRTPQGAMAEFNKIYGGADHEWGAEIDSQGYVRQFVEGAAHEVGIFGSAGRFSKMGRNNQSLILHNHPSASAFSKADMLSFANGAEHGIVASGTKYNYIMTKGTHFKANDFVKAINRATITGKDYSDAVHKWLTKNATKYGYKYERRAAGKQKSKAISNLK